MTQQGVVAADADALYQLCGLAMEEGIMLELADASPFCRWFVAGQVAAWLFVQIWSGDWSESIT